jgi:diguanylate cyclase (GGDEF)-like protein/PAS domain S-box-containing protein
MRLPYLSIDKPTDQLFLLDGQGRIINANEAACQTLGFSRAELLTMRFDQIDSLLAAEVWFKYWLELEKSRLMRYESEHRNQDGSLTPVSIVSRFIQLEGQDYICAIAQVPVERSWNMTESDESNERFRLLFEQAGVGMARASVNSEFLQVNDAFSRLLGYSREEILAKSMTFHQITHANDLETSLAHYQRLLDGHTASCSIILRYVQKCGALVWVNLSVSLLRDTLGNPLYFIFTALDISAAKRTEEFQQLAAAVFAHTHDAIVVTDVRGRIESVNPAFVELTGYPEDEVRGRHARLFKSSRHQRSFYAALSASLKTCGHWRGEIWLPQKNGEIHPRMMTISAIGNSAAEAVRYVSIFSDISQLKESEAQLNFLAYNDPLTGLANRRSLEMRLEQALEFARRYHRPLALLIIDMDHFKEVNDNLGHPAGDELLIEVGRRFSQRLLHGDTLARLGGDEFAILLENPADRETVGRIAEDLLAQLAPPVALRCGTEIKAQASIGVCWHPDHGDRYSDLIQNADVALYQAKRAGRGTFFFSPNLAPVGETA